MPPSSNDRKRYHARWLQTGVVACVARPTPNAKRDADPAVGCDRSDRLDGGGDLLASALAGPFVLVAHPAVRGRPQPGGD